MAVRPVLPVGIIELTTVFLNLLVPRDISSLWGLLGLASTYWSLTMSAIWRIETCKLHSGYRSSASIYNNIRDGLWTKAVPIGLRSVGWPSYEVEAINKYRIAGASDDQIRELVTRLHAKRSELLSGV